MTQLKNNVYFKISKLRIFTTPTEFYNLQYNIGSIVYDHGVGKISKPNSYGGFETYMFKYLKNILRCTTSKKYKNSGAPRFSSANYHYISRKAQNQLLNKDKLKDVFHEDPHNYFLFHTSNIESNNFYNNTVELNLIY